jgi:molybdopterin/thiamine biosynthesis adenylyltransferase
MQVVVLCGVSYKKQLEINDWTHENGVHFIAAETRGLFGYVLLSILPSFLIPIFVSVPHSTTLVLNSLAWTPPASKF